MKENGNLLPTIQERNEECYAHEIQEEQNVINNKRLQNLIKKGDFDFPDDDISI